MQFCRLFWSVRRYRWSRRDFSVILRPISSDTRFSGRTHTLAVCFFLENEPVKITGEIGEDEFSFGPQEAIGVGGRGYSRGADEAEPLVDTDMDFIAEHRQGD